MTDSAHMPATTSIPNLLCYEDLLAAQNDHYEWPAFDERLASSMCYTSGTTGNPKGVLYSHRSTMLHTFAVALPDGLNRSRPARWSCPWCRCSMSTPGASRTRAAMVGAKLVFPGAALDGKSLHELMEAEGVTVSAGVPTVWQGLLGYMEQHATRLFDHAADDHRRRSAAARDAADVRGEVRRQGTARMGDDRAVALGTACALRPHHGKLDPEGQYKVKSKQGRAIYGIDMKIVDADGNELPQDGVAFGDLLVRGPWVVNSYFRGEGGDPLVTDEAGVTWFPTGDVATIDPEGYMQITDRSKDVIKSGGEWISSIDIENVAMSHPAVAMSACIGVAHPKWDERPLLVVVKKAGKEVTREELLRHYEGKVAKWQIPDDIAFVEAIPMGATGKMLKNKLREQFRDHRLPQRSRLRARSKTAGEIAGRFLWRSRQGFGAGGRSRQRIRASNVEVIDHRPRLSRSAWFCQGTYSVLVANS